MYIKKQNYDNALKKVKVEFGTIIGLDTDAEAFVILKEMDTLTTLKLRSLSDNSDEIISFFKDILPTIIVDHNLYESEDKKMSAKEVASFIFEKLELSTKVMSDYTSAIFRVKPDAKNGDPIAKS